MAVSGGPDSLALLHLLTRLRGPWQLGLLAIHVDHGLRPDSRDDARFVEEAGRALGVPVIVRTADVKAERRPGESWQQAARRVRYRLLEEVAAAEGAHRVALAHHADDQAETILLRLLRGAGAAGLGGMRPKRGLYVRPLLWVARQEIEAYCRAFRLSFRADPTNRSLRYLRNRIRHRLLPLLEAEFNPNVRAVLNRTATLLREDDDYLEELARQAFQQLGRPEDGLSVDGLSRLPRPLARRVLRLAVQQAGVELAAVSAAHVDRMLSLAGDEAPKAGCRPVTLPGGVRVRRESGRLVMEWPGTGGETGDEGGGAVDCPLVVPGRTVVEPWNVAVEADLIPCAQAGSRNAARSLQGPAARGDGEAPGGSAGRHGEGPVREVDLDWEQVVPPLRVRAWRPGDRMRPLGLGGSKKLQDIFVDAKVPAKRRHQVPVICDEQGILWLAGLRVDERGAAGPRTRQVLRLRVVPL
ncbi:MAG: tRNA lysidine(34) synthetase TilS [Firmicutes bacterium]|nr:tRNA lysidine(34) synthetase TilS [Bacillota bacterium]